MAQVRIVTDSTCSLAPGMAKDLGISVVPLQVVFGEESFREGIEITDDQFYDRLRTTTVHPRTSQPSPGELAEAYRKLRDEGAGAVVSIHISGGLSGTVQSAEMASRLVPGLEVRVLDSQSVSLGLGMVVLAAARAARAGQDAAAVEAAARSVAGRISVLFAVDTLEYLERNGRIGKAQAFLGTLLSVKPLLGLQDGIVVPLDRVRGSSRVNPRLVELIVERAGKGSRLRVAVMDAQAPAAAEELLARIAENYELVEVIRGGVGPVVGAHTGPGTVGVCFYRD